MDHSEENARIWARVVEAERERKKERLIKRAIVIALIAVALVLATILDNYFHPFPEYAKNKVHEAWEACSRLNDTYTKEFDDCMEFSAGRELSYVRSHPDPANNNIPQWLQRDMDEAAVRVKADQNGELGQRARETCRRTIGIAENVKTHWDILRRYGADKTFDYDDCVVNQMYPDPATRPK